MKIHLKDIKPPIWRRILIPSHFTFEQLHDTIQKFMGWDGYHLHDFHYQQTIPVRNIITIRGKDPAGKNYYPEVYGEDNLLEDKVKLKEIFNDDVKKVIYTYDFGDNWRHDIILEKILEYKESDRYPQLIKSVGDCPPEDCGGPYGYMNLVDDDDDDDGVNYFDEDDDEDEVIENNETKRT